MATTPAITPPMTAHLVPELALADSLGGGGLPALLGEVEVLGVGAGVGEGDPLAGGGPGDLLEGDGEGDLGLGEGDGDGSGIATESMCLSTTWSVWMAAGGREKTDMRAQERHRGFGWTWILHYSGCDLCVQIQQTCSSLVLLALIDPTHAWTQRMPGQ
jgi:hypothetical protein